MFIYLYFNFYFYFYYAILIIGTTVPYRRRSRWYQMHQTMVEITSYFGDLGVHKTKKGHRARQVGKYQTSRLRMWKCSVLFNASSSPWSTLFLHTAFCTYSPMSSPFCRAILCTEGSIGMGLGVVMFSANVVLWSQLSVTRASKQWKPHPRVLSEARDHPASLIQGLRRVNSGEIYFKQVGMCPGI